MALHECVKASASQDAATRSSASDSGSESSGVDMPVVTRPLSAKSRRSTWSCVFSTNSDELLPEDVRLHSRSLGRRRSMVLEPVSAERRTVDCPSFGRIADSWPLSSFSESEPSDLRRRTSSDNIVQDAEERKQRRYRTNQNMRRYSLAMTDREVDAIAQACQVVPAPQSSPANGDALGHLRLNLPGVAAHDEDFRQEPALHGPNPAAEATFVTMDPAAIPPLISQRSSSSQESSQSHIHRWHLPEESLIIFDWDDTLCPTTYIHEDPRLSWSRPAPCFSVEGGCIAEGAEDLPVHPPESPRSKGSTEVPTPTMAEALRRHVENVSNLLRAARKLANVVIVTLAKRGWVATSSKNFLPGVHELIGELGIEVIYARDALHGFQLRSAVVDEMDVFMLMKKEAMKRCVKRLYRNRRSWKNIMSIGDSACERDALQDLIFLRSQPNRRGEEKKCRCKTLKLPEDPDIQQLTTELEVLTLWLQPLVLHDGDLNLDLENPGESLSVLRSVLVDSAYPSSQPSSRPSLSPPGPSPRPLVAVDEST